MLRIAAIVFVVFSSMLFAASALAAGSDCRFCLDSVALQTRDGQPWTAGKPVTLVVHVASATTTPATAQAVVMQTDGDRTKCLGVPLKLVSSDATGGLYAGLFFPFRAARYDGVLVVDGEVQNITFNVEEMAAGAAPAGELPAAEPLDTSAPLPPLVAIAQLPATRAAAFGLLSVLVLGGYLRQRRLRQAM